MQHRRNESARGSQRARIHEFAGLSNANEMEKQQGPLFATETEDGENEEQVNAYWSQSYAKVVLSTIQKSQARLGRGPLGRIQTNY